MVLDPSEHLLKENTFSKKRGQIVRMREVSGGLGRGAAC